jgi:hypothetical protein
VHFLFASDFDQTLSFNDPEFRAVRREHLIETGRRVRLKKDIPRLVDFLSRGVDRGVALGSAPVDAAGRDGTAARPGISGGRPADGTPATTPRHGHTNVNERDLDVTVTASGPVRPASRSS